MRCLVWVLCVMLSPFAKFEAFAAKCPWVTDDNKPLQNISSVTVFPMLPTKSPTDDEKIISFICTELAKVGVVQQFSIETDKGLDLSQLSGPGLIYELHSLQSISGKSLPVMNASLNLEQKVTCSKEEYLAYTWNTDCFWEKETPHTLEQEVQLSFVRLLTQFMDSYRSA